MSKMKKTAAIVVAAALTLTVLPAVALATVAPQHRAFSATTRLLDAASIQASAERVTQAAVETQAAAQAAPAAVAADASTPCPGYTDADGDGICDYCWGGHGGAGYVDADGDGVCDNYGTGNGCGAGYGRGAGAGQGSGAAAGQGNGAGAGAARGAGHHGGGHGCYRA